MAASLSPSVSKAPLSTTSIVSRKSCKSAPSFGPVLTPPTFKMLGRLGAQLGRSLQLSTFATGLSGPTNGARTLAAFAGNFQRNVGYAPPPPQEEAQAPQSEGAAGGLREVPFSKDITNNVRVMGRLGRDPELKRLETGRTVAKMALALSKPKSTDGTVEDAEWIDVETWDAPGNELATMAANSLRKGLRVAVQGRLRIDKWDDRKTGEKRSRAKIIADDLALVSDAPGMEYSQGASYTAQQGGGFAAGGSNYPSTSAASPVPSTPAGRRTPEELWESYFAYPGQWWDNRNGKTNPRAPDFKHKETKEALWIDSRSTPPSVLTRLAEENPSAGPDLDVTLEELWQNLYEDPGSWWDNRTNKKYPGAPDFTNKETRQGLRIDDPNAPDYLVSKEALADLDERFVLVAKLEKEEYQELWDDLFANPGNWYDNRVNKKNPKGPDFVNKDNRDIVLWMNDKRNTDEILNRIPGALGDVSQGGYQQPAHQAYGSNGGQ